MDSTKDIKSNLDPQIELNNMLNHAICSKKIEVEAEHINLLINCIAQHQNRLEIMQKDIKDLTKHMNDLIAVVDKIADDYKVEEEEKIIQ